MKTKREAGKLRKMAAHLQDFLQEAGYKVEVYYKDDGECFIIRNTETDALHYINVRASSVSACARDIFRQGLDILTQTEKYI